MTTQVSLEQLLADSAERGNARARSDELAESLRESARRRAELERPRGFGRTMADTGLALGSGVVGLGQAAYGLGNMATFGTLDRATGIAGSFEAAQDGIRGLQSEQLQARREQQQQAFDQSIGAGVMETLTSGTLMADLLFSQLPSLLPVGIASSVAGRSAAALASTTTNPATRKAILEAGQKSSERAAVRTIGAQMGGSANVEAINAIREAGGTENEAQINALLTGLGVGVGGAAISRVSGAARLESAVANRLAGNPIGATGGVGAGLVRGAAGGAARETTEETLQSGLEAFGVNLATPGRDAGEGVGQAMAMGAIGGGMLGAGMGASAGGARANQQAQELRGEIADGLEGTEVGTEGDLSKMAKDSGPTGEVQPGSDLDAALTETNNRDMTRLRQALDADRAVGLTPEQSVVSEVEAMALESLLAQTFEVGQSGDQTVYRSVDSVTGVQQEFDQKTAIEMVQSGLPVEMEQRLSRLFGEANSFTLIETASQQEGEMTPEQRMAQVSDRLDESRARGFTNITMDQLPADPGDPRAPQDLGPQPLPVDPPFTPIIDLPQQPMPVERPLMDRPVADAGLQTPAFQDAADAGRQPLPRDPDDAGPQRVAIPPTDGQGFQRMSRPADGRAVDEPAPSPMSTQPRPPVTPADTLVSRPATPVPDPGNVAQNTQPVTANLRQVTAGRDTTLAPFVLVNQNTGEVRPYKTRRAAENRARAHGGNVLNTDQAIAEGVIELTEDLPTGPTPVVTPPQPTTETSRPVVREKQQEKVEGSRTAAAVQAATTEPSTVPGVQTKAKAPMPESRRSPQNRRAEKQVKDAIANPEQAWEQFLRTKVPGMRRFSTETSESWSTFKFMAGRKKLDPRNMTTEQINDFIAEVNGVIESDGDGGEAFARHLSKYAGVDLNQVQAGALTNAVAEAIEAGQTEVEGVTNFLTNELATRNEVDFLNAYTVFQNSTVFERMDAQARDQLQTFVENNGNPEGRTMFHRPAQSDQRTALPPMSEAAFDRAMDRINAERLKRNLFPIQSAESAADVAAQFGVTVPPDVAGAYLPNRTMIVVRQNIKNNKELVETIQHERTHSGVDAVLGGRRKAALNRLWANAAMRPRIKAKMDTGLNRLDAAEEVMVDMVVQGERLSGDVLSKFRSAMADFGKSMLGVSQYSVSNRDVDNLIDVLADSLGPRPRQNPEVMLASKDFSGMVDMLLSDFDGINRSPMFSRAYGDTAEKLSDFPLRGAPHNTTMDLSSARAAGGNVVTMLKNAYQSASEGGFRQNMLKFLPLNQIAALYGNRLPSLKRLSASVWAKENAMNKALHVRTVQVQDGGKTVNVSPKDIAIRWAKFSNKNREGTLNLNAMTQTATAYELWPDRAFKDQLEVDYDSVPYTEAQREAVANELARLWDSVGPEGRFLFNATQSVYRDQMRQQRDAAIAEHETLTGRPFYKTDDGTLQGTPITDRNGNRVVNDEFGTEGVRKVFQNMVRVMRAPYSPLSREGKYLVTVSDEAGKSVWFSAHDSVADAEATMNEIREDYPLEKGFKRKQRVASDYHREIDGVDQSLVAQMEGYVAQAYANTMQGQEQSDIDALVQKTVTDMKGMYLNSLPAHHFLQHSRARQGVSGYNLNARDAFGTYMMKSARRIASLKHDGDIGRSMAQMQQEANSRPEENQRELGSVVNAVRSHQVAVMNRNTSAIADTASAASFLYYMLSPSQFVVNASQTPLVAWPLMAAKFRSPVKAIGHLNRAYQLFFASGAAVTQGSAGLRAEGTRAKLDDTTNMVIDQLHESGVLDFTQSQDFADTGAHDTAVFGGRVAQKWGAAKKAAVIPLHASEVMNRQVTAYATIQLAMEQNSKLAAPLEGQALVDHLTETATEMVNESQYMYIKGNMPEVLQGSWPSMFFKFQQFRINTLALHARKLRDAYWNGEISKAERSEARRFLAYSIGTQLTTLGATGTILSPVAFFLMDLFDDEDDLMNTRQRFVMARGDMMAYGLIGQVMDTARIDMGTTLPIIGSRHYWPTDATAAEMLSHHAQELTGPSLSVLDRWARGYEAAQRGDTIGAAGIALPRGAADPIRAINDMNKSVRNRDGIVTYEPTWADTVFTAVGLVNAEQKKLRDNQGVLYSANRKLTRRRSNIIGEIVLAQELNEQDSLRQAYQRLEEFNTLHPEAPITTGLIRSAGVRRIRQQEAADQNNVPFSIDNLPESTRNMITRRQ